MRRRTSLVDSWTRWPPNAQTRWPCCWSRCRSWWCRMSRFKSLGRCWCLPRRSANVMSWRGTCEDMGWFYNSISHMNYSLNRRYEAMCIHGDKKQEERDWVLKEFRFFTIFVFVDLHYIELVWLLTITYPGLGRLRSWWPPMLRREALVFET